MNSGRRPYVRVAEGLKKRIEAGEWQPGEMIPARRVLAAEYDVALATLERAAGQLIAEGVLSASDRRGTFVARHRFEKSGMNGVSAASPTPRDSLRATVGIVAAIAPYKEPERQGRQWPAQILAACERGLSVEHGLTQRFLNLCQDRGPRITPRRAAEQLLADGVDVLVVIEDSKLEGMIPLLETTRVPILCVGYDPVAVPMPQVYVDSTAGGALAVRHLRERGYHHLTYLRPYSAVWAEARLSGAQAAAGPVGLRVFPADAPKDVLAVGDQRATGLEVGRALFKEGVELGTGFIAPNDSVAIGFAEAATECGFQAGRDYGLIGFDDRYRETHLTSLCPPLDHLGEEVALLAMRLLRREPCPTRIALQHSLISRASTCGVAETKWVSRN